MKREEGDDSFDVLFHDALDDEVFKALSDVHRRAVIYYLLEVEATSLDELLDVVTGWLHVEGDRMATREDRIRIERAFYHWHLSKLLDAELIHYDEPDRRVELADLSEPERALVEWSYDREFGRDCT